LRIVGATSQKTIIALAVPARSRAVLTNVHVRFVCTRRWSLRGSRRAHIGAKKGRRNGIIEEGGIEKQELDAKTCVFVFSYKIDL
jgi:hypothetical protein